MSGNESKLIFPTEEMMRNRCRPQDRVRCTHLSLMPMPFGNWICTKGTYSSGDGVTLDDCAGIIGFLCDGSFRGRPVIVHGQEWRVNNLHTVGKYPTKDLVLEASLKSQDGAKLVSKIPIGEFNILQVYIPIHSGPVLKVSAIYERERDWLFPF